MINKNKNKNVQFSHSSSLDRSQADSLEHTRFLSNDPSLYAGGKGCQFAQSPIKALQQQQQPDQVGKSRENPFFFIKN